MTFKNAAILAAALLAAACSIGGSEDSAAVGVLRMVNFTSETAQFRIGDSTYVLQPHEVSEPQAITLEAGQIVVTPGSGAPITVPIPLRNEDQALVAGVRGHPLGSMPAAISYTLNDTLPFPQVTITYSATSSAATNVDIYKGPAAGVLGPAPVATAVNEATFSLEATVWQLVVRRAGTSEVIYRNPAVQFNTRDPACFFLVPRTAGGFEGVLVTRNRTQTYPDVR
jgi:hypothetical protein